MFEESVLLFLLISLTYVFLQINNFQDYL
jgi:hypothetical protein